jgi:hypothetical protein
LSGISLILIEFLSYHYGAPWVFIASRLWVISGFFYLCYSANFVFDAFKKDFLKSWLNFIFTLVLWSGISWLCFRWVNSLDKVEINGEATQQVGGALRALNRPDWAYTLTGFIGYPMRQYLITAIPTLLNGIDVTNLRLGFALPFVTGLLVFYAGLRSAFTSKMKMPSAIGLVVLALMSFPFVGEYYLTFEQAILPLSFCLHATGWFLLLLTTPRLSTFFCLSWIGALLGTSYTPALAAWILLLGALSIYLLHIYHNKSLQTLLLGGASLIVILGFGLFSFYTRMDLFRSQDVKDLSIRPDYVISLKQGLSMIVWDPYKPFIPPLLLLPVAVFLLGVFFSQKKLLLIPIIVWSVGVALAALTLNGYVPRPAHVDLHRALVVLPPFLASAVAFYLSPSFSTRVYEWLKGWKLVILFVLLSCVLGGNAWHSFSNTYWRQAGPLEKLIGDMPKLLSNACVDPFKVERVFAVSKLDRSALGNLTSYFTPKADFVMIKIEDNPQPITVDLSKTTLLYIDSKSTDQAEANPLFLDGAVLGTNVQHLSANTLTQIQTETPTSILDSCKDSFKSALKKAPAQYCKLAEMEIAALTTFQLGTAVPTSPSTYIQEERSKFYTSLISKRVERTQWKWEEGNVTFYKNGRLDSTWGAGTWAMKADGTFTATFPGNDFLHTIIFDPTFSKFTATRVDGTRVAAKFQLSF